MYQVEYYNMLGQRIMCKLCGCRPITSKETGLCAKCQELNTIRLKCECGQCGEIDIGGGMIVFVQDMFPWEEMCITIDPCDEYPWIQNKKHALPYNPEWELRRDIRRDEVADLKEIQDR